MSDRPAPLTTPEMDVRDLDGFMLNVERMMASELVALSTGDEFKAAVRLWCRAWKQVPAGSLPNEERVLAAFSGAGSKWPKVRKMALRGFVECSDGRLYHQVLCEDVYRAWSQKQNHLENKNADTERKKRERDERSQMFAALKSVGVTPQWNAPTRALRALVTEHVTHLSRGQVVTGHAPVTDASRGNPEPVTPNVTANTGQDRTGQDSIPKPKGFGCVAAANGHESKPAWWPIRDRYGRITCEITDKIMFDVAKAVLGSGHGGLITRFRKTPRGDMRTITEFLLQADEKSNPREWFAGVLKRAEQDEMPNPPHEVYPETEYRA